MDALHRSILNIWWQWEQNWGEDSARPIDERTSFNIASAFALENGTLQQGAIQTLSENELTARLPRDDAGNLNQAHLSGTDEWYEHLVHQKLLSAKPPNTTATLNVIYVHRDYCPHRGMASSTLLDIFTLFGLNTSFFRLISIQGETWHFVRRDDGTCTFLVIISSLYSLAYNVSLIGRQTNCVIFGRSFKNINRALDVTHFNFYQPAWFDNDVAFNAGRAFPLLLKSIQPYALHHPLSLAYLCLLDIMSSTFVEVSDEYATINALERATNADAVAQERLDLWVSLSQGAGRTNTQLAKISNTIEVASLLLKTLEDRKGWEKWCRRFVATADYQTGLHRRATKWLAEGLPSCRLLLEHEKTQLRLQDNRVRALTPIIFAHLTRADAQSIKTIAVMTMAFLPATAIAAIFAVPWERGSHRVQTAQGIVYCTVTVCMTILVFLVWRSGAKWLKWFRNQHPRRRGAMWLKRFRNQHPAPDID